MLNLEEFLYILYDHWSFAHLYRVISMYVEVSDTAITLWVTNCFPFFLPLISVYACLLWAHYMLQAKNSGLEVRRTPLLLYFCLLLSMLTHSDIFKGYSLNSYLCKILREKLGIRGVTRKMWFLPQWTSICSLRRRGIEEKKYNRSFHMSVIENHLEAIKRHKLSTCRLENCLQMKFFFFFFWLIYISHISDTYQFSLYILMSFEDYFKQIWEGRLS